jgi:ActR/RegA family two-component response regulator
MSVITIFSGTFCREESVIRDVLSSTGYKSVSDKEIVAKASKHSGIAEDKINRAFASRTSVFNKFTHEKECSIAYLKLALAEMLADTNLLIVGFTGQLIPKTISHVLRVCLIAGLKFRISEAFHTQGLTEKEARKLIRSHDEDRSAWIEFLFEKNDPWDTSLYDLTIPMGKVSSEKAGSLVEENLLKYVVKPTEESIKAVADFFLAAKVEVALVREGHNVDVTARDGLTMLTINKHVLMLSRLEDELKSIAEKVPGVTTVETKIGKGYHKSDIYRRHDFDKPSKVLLVDDEREFVQTLSERLLLRDMGSAVAYDGESALDLIKEDEPEVMILDLKMPGIDGMEVLKKVKETRPEMEVIILTGHGNESDRALCMKLGAFAYLQKPLDINVLSETIQRANDKIRLKKADKGK